MTNKKGEKNYLGDSSAILKRIRRLKDIEKRDNVYTRRLIKIRNSVKHRLRKRTVMLLHR